MAKEPDKSIISRPVYGKLEATNASYHLFVADAEGAQAILDMKVSLPAEFFARTHIIYIPRDSDNKFLAGLQTLNAKQFYAGPSIETALLRLKQTLLTAHMGTQIYLAGSEGLIGQAMQIALEVGIDHSSIQTEQRGSKARRVQCVHCKGITDNVTTQPVTCSHCDLLLLVRDHYSRRYAAFQGVCINAEDPTYIPEKEEIFR